MWRCSSLEKLREIGGQTNPTNDLSSRNFRQFTTQSFFSPKISWNWRTIKQSTFFPTNFVALANSAFQFQIILKHFLSNHCLSFKVAHFCFQFNFIFRYFLSIYLNFARTQSMRLDAPCFTSEVKTSFSRSKLLQIDFTKYFVQYEGEFFFPTVWNFLVLSTAVLIDFGRGANLEEIQNNARRNFFPWQSHATPYFFLTQRHTLIRDKMGDPTHDAK